jgi:hypothetical protein
MEKEAKLTRSQVWLIAGFLAILVVMLTWGTWHFFTTRIPGGNDFVAFVAAWESFIFEGHSPYSEEAALRAQDIIYGRPAMEGEDEARMIYPFFSILIHGPFVFIDYPLARALYMTILEASIIIGVVLTLDLVGWHPPTWMLAIVIAWSLLFYPQGRAVLLGQFAPIGFLSLAGTLWLLRKKKDLAAGALLVLSTVKPTLVFLIVPFLLLWAGTQRRWRFVASFAVVLGILVGGSLLASPRWIGEWFMRVIGYAGYTVGQSPVWLLAHEYLPWMGSVGEYILVAFLLGGVIWIWWRDLRAGGKGFLWSLSITLVVSNLIVPRSATTNYALMLVPMIWLMAACDRMGRRWRWLSLGGMIILLIGHWWLFAATVVGDQEQAVMFLPLPLLLGALLLLGRSWLEKDAEKTGITL